MLHTERLYPVLMQTMNDDTICPEQEQSYSADKSLLVVSMQFESAISTGNVVIGCSNIDIVTSKTSYQCKNAASTIQIKTNL